MTLGELQLAVRRAGLTDTLSIPVISGEATYQQILGGLVVLAAVQANVEGLSLDYVVADRLREIAELKQFATTRQSADRPKGGSSNGT